MMFPATRAPLCHGCLSSRLNLVTKDMISPEKGDGMKQTQRNNCKLAWETYKTLWASMEIYGNSGFNLRQVPLHHWIGGPLWKRCRSIWGITKKIPQTEGFGEPPEEQDHLRP